MNQLVVKKHQPFRIALIVCALSISLAAMMWIFVENDHWSYIKQRMQDNIAHRQLWDVNQTLQEENEKLKEKVVMLERATQIDNQAAAGLQEELRRLQDAVYKLKGELEFYQGIMSETSETQGLNIQGLHIVPMAQDSHYQYKLVLTHVSKNGIVQAEGQIKITLEGMQESELTSLPLAKVSPERELDLSYKFKNFKRFEGSINLPEGFQPMRVIVQVREKGRQKFNQRVFEWPIKA